MLVLGLVIFIDFIGFGIIIPLAAQFQTMFHLTPFSVGFFTASFAFTNLIGSLVFGSLSDKIGRKPVLLGTTILLAITYFVNAYIQMYAFTFTSLLILRAIIGFFSGNIPVAFAAAADLSADDIEKRRKNMAILGMSIGLGFMLGPTLGGVLAEMTVSRTIAPFYFASILTAILFIMIWALFKESLPKLSGTKKQQDDRKQNVPSISLISQLKELLTNKQVIITSSLYFGFFFTFAGFEIYLLTTTLAMQLHLDQLELGLIWTAFAVFNSFFQFLLLKLAKMKRALILGFFIYSFSIFSLLYSSSSVWLVLISMVISAIGTGFVMPNLNTAISLKGNPEQQGTIFGINQSLGNLGRGLGPFILGGIFNLFNSINAVWISMGLLIFFLGFVVIKYIPNDAVSPRSRAYKK